MRTGVGGGKAMETEGLCCCRCAQERNGEAQGLTGAITVCCSVFRARATLCVGRRRDEREPEEHAITVASLLALKSTYFWREEPDMQG